MNQRNSYGQTWREVRKQLMDHPQPSPFRPLNRRRKTDPLDWLSRAVGVVVMVLLITIAGIQIARYLGWFR